MHFTICEAPNEAFVSTLERLLMSFNLQASKRGYDGRTLGIQLLASDAVTIVGGLLGTTSYGYLHIDAVFVPDSLRGSGFGRAIVLMAEQEAKKRDCTGAWLDTFSFQARGFYEKLGYELFGELPDNPPRHTRYFFRKLLPAPNSLEVG